VLILNPDNSQARKGLDFIRTKGTRDLSAANGAMAASQQADTVAPFDPTTLAAPTFQSAPLVAPPEVGTFEAELPSAVLDVQPGPPVFAPSEGGVADLPDFLQTTSARADASHNAAPEPAVAEAAQPPAVDLFGDIDGVLPFEAPDAADMPTYTGGPPTPGLPPDMGAAMPEWVRGSDDTQGAEPPAAPQFDAAQQDVMGAHTEAEMPGFAGGAMAASLAAPGEPSTGPSPDTDLNAWLEELTSSSKFQFEDQAQGDTSTSHLGAQGSGSDTSANLSHNADPYTQSGPFPADPFANPGPLDFSPVGPYGSGSDLPSPDDLPGDHGADGQPWYLQSSHPSGFIGSPGGMADDTTHFGTGPDGRSVAAAAVAAQIATVECPYCFHHVPETSLQCPECRYTFFVHCPHCHELVDTSLAREGVVEPCPYCAVEINKWDLGMNNAKGLIMPHAVAKESDASWLGQPLEGPKRRRGLSFGWLVDVMWLIIVVLMVWALTQLPTWLHLTGLYN
jgi:hypothetical protein